jgi:2'-5' RNA ligase
MTTRTQLSLYVPSPLSEPLEEIRRRLDPIQRGLIPAHVTLCREDEIAALALGPSEIRARLAEAGAAPITLRFGRPESFHGHGVLLPCIDGAREFQALREHVLGSRAIRHPEPHLTLAHPRNPRSPHNDLANAGPLPDDLSITFTTVSLIQQTGPQPWRVLEAYALGPRKRGHP